MTQRTRSERGIASELFHSVEEDEDLAEGKTGGSRDTHVIIVATVKLIATHTQ